MSEKLRAAVLTQPGKPLRIMDLAIPELGQGQLLIKIRYAGICRSQLMEWKGHRGVDKWLPHMLGHEAVGTVIGIGEGVTKVDINDDVIVGWIKGEGIDADPPKFMTGNKTINCGPVTTFSNYSIISENRVYKKPTSIDDILAVLLGCALPTGAGMVLNEVNLNKSDNVGVIGLGGIGLSSILGLVDLGIRKIVAIDLDDKKLNLAKKLGAHSTINPQNKSVHETVFNLTERGFDYCFESGGTTESIMLGFDLIKQNGGELIFASHPPSEQKIEISPHDLISGKKIRGSWGGACKPDADIPRIAKIAQNTPELVNELSGQIYSLDDINKAIADFDEGKCFRPIIKMAH